MTSSRTINAEALHRLRTGHGFTMAELAARAGLSQATISRIEMGHAPRVRPETLARIADALHISAGALAGDEWSASVDDPRRNRAVARINMASQPTLSEVHEFLADFGAAYSALNSFLMPAETATHRPARDVASAAFNLSVGDEIVIYRVSFQSPGFWEFLASLGPLMVLTTYLQQRHERKKDIAYRNRAEEKRLGLENALLENEVAKGRIAVLRDLGMTEEEIRIQLSTSIAPSLERVGRSVETGLVTGASITDSGK